MATESAPEEVHAEVHDSGPSDVALDAPELRAKEVRWHDDHGKDLTAVREFEPRCVGTRRARARAARRPRRGRVDAASGTALARLSTPPAPTSVASRGPSPRPSGSSSCVNVVGAVKVARALGPGHRVVTIACDSGVRHLTKFWSPEYLEKHGLTPRATGSGLEFLGASLQKFFTH